MEFSQQRRIKVDGYHHSDVHFYVALCVLNAGGVGMVIDGIEPTLQNLSDIRNLLDGMVKEIDRKLPALVLESVNKQVAA